MGPPGKCHRPSIAIIVNILYRLEINTSSMQYQIKMSGDPEQKLKQARELAAERGVTFIGDGTKGKFSGRIMGGRLNGFYWVEKGILSITIIEKPLLTTWNMIEVQLREFLRS